MNERAKIGDYRIIQKLGCGGAGDVFLATPIKEKRFANPGEPVAIKFYNDRVLAAPNQLARVRREFNVGSQLACPHLVRMHECNIDEKDGTYLVMQYIDGMPLSQWIAMFHPASDALLVKTLLSVARGISALHEAKTVHRDIKPENIMMSSNFAPKLMDFGVVKVEHVDGETPSDSFIGTIRNASPEWLQGKEHDDVRMDLYSFGTVIYAMLHGHQVFHTERQFARLMELVLHQKPRVDESLRSRAEPVPTLVQMAERLMEKQPADRPSSIDEVLAVLEEADKASPSEIKPLHGYMATALTGVPKDTHDLIAFQSGFVADVCKDFGIYVYQPRMMTDPLAHANVDAEIVYAQDRKRILTADLLVLSADHPSFGVGQEIEIAASFGVPTIIIQRKSATAKISRMITGSPLNLIGEITYSSREELNEKLREVIGNNMAKIRSFEASIRPEISQQIGERLRQIRQQAGLSVEDAATKIGTSSRLIRSIEERPLDEHNIGLHVLGRLLVAYESDLAELFGPPKLRPMPTKNVDRNLRTLEEVAESAGWPARDYFELRDDYEKQIAASGDTERVDADNWLRRHSALEKRRIADQRAKKPRDSELGDLFAT